MNNYYTVFVNGEAFSYFSPISMYDLILYLNFDIDNIIVEYNKIVIPNREFEYTSIRDQDSLEIITIVGGG